MEISERLATQMENIIVSRINEDRLITPSPRHAARRYAELARDAKAPRDFSSTLGKDPLFAARLLHAADGMVESLDEAVGEMGATKLKPFLLESSRLELATSFDPEIQRAADALWRHSTAVAVLSRDLATISGNADGEAAYTAGLLHDVGKLVIATLLLEAEKLLAAELRNGGWIERNAWIDVIRRTHGNIAKALADRWMLPSSVKSLLRDGPEYDIMDRSSAANVARFADALAESEGIHDNISSPADAKALVMVGRSLLNIDDDFVTRLSRDIHTRIASE